MPASGLMRIPKTPQLEWVCISTIVFSLPHKHRTFDACASSIFLIVFRFVFVPLVRNIFESLHNIDSFRYAAVRVRPPLKPTDPGYDLVPQRFRGSTCNVTSPTSLTVESSQGKKLFVFDRVFGEDVDQEGVWEYLSESVNSFVQGYNVSLLAYGQSGAGKSYTMGTTGPNEQGSAKLMGMYNM